MKTKKYITVIVLLSLAILLSYSLPKAKYVGTGFISNLNIPLSIPGWQGRDVTSEVGLESNSSTYDFVSEAVAYQYVNNMGKSLLFIILDAGNFHHPKVCFTGAGFKITEMDDTTFNLSDRSLQTHTLFTQRGKDNFISFYWISINKNIAHEWVEQKLKQLFFSLFGKKRVGLMVRVDIPAMKEDIEESTALASQFILEINKQIQSENSAYIFGLE